MSSQKYTMYTMLLFNRFVVVLPLTASLLKQFCNTLWNAVLWPSSRVNYTFPVMKNDRGTIANSSLSMTNVLKYHEFDLEKRNTPTEIHLRIWSRPIGPFKKKKERYFLKRLGSAQMMCEIHKTIALLNSPLSATLERHQREWPVCED